jgi:hypothetical protein
MINRHKKPKPTKGGLRDMCIDFEKMLPAVIGVAASLLTLLITRLFDTRSEKRKERERFFYEIYKQRLALYRRILKQIYLFSDVTCFAPPYDPEKFGEIAESFLELSDMGALVASPAVISVLNTISNFIRDSVAVRQTLGSAEGVDAFVSFMAEHSALLRTRIRAETCPSLVDKYLSELTEKMVSL